MDVNKLNIRYLFLFVLITSSLLIYRFYRCTFRGSCPIKVTEEVDRIKLTLWSPKRLYETDETVDIKINIKNKRRDQARLFPTEDQPAIELTYDTNSGSVYWHEEHPEVAKDYILIEPGDYFEIVISIPPNVQPELEHGSLCARIQVNYPSGYDGGYGFGTCITYNNRPY
jgi:hypothetical protein